MCAPRGYPAPAGYEVPPSGWTSVRPAATPRTRNPQHNTASERTGEQVPRGSGHRTAHGASAPVKNSQGAQDTAHATQHTERAHRCTGAKWPRTPHKQINAPSGHTGEQQPSGPGNCTSTTTHQAGTPVNKSQGAEDTAHTGNAPSGHTGEQEPSGPGHRTSKTIHGAGKPVNRSQVAQAPNMQSNAPSGHTAKQEPSGPGHRTSKTTSRAGTPVNRSQVAQDTAHATQQTARAHR